IEIENPEPTQEPDEDPAPLVLTPEIEPAVRNAVLAAGETDNVVGEVEPDATGSSGEYVGNIIAQQTTTTRSCRRTTAPAHCATIVSGAPDRWPQTPNVSPPLIVTPPLSD
ncbi:Uncharacterized protein APZ42_010746, partial [Daphnia magna]